MKNTLILVFFLTLIAPYCLIHSQTKIKGQVIDENEIPIKEAVAIHILNETDKIISSKLVDSIGYFTFSDVNFNNENIKIIAVGYESFNIRYLTDYEDLKIILHPLEVELKEVVIKGTSNIILKNDRLIFNIVNENIIKGNNSYELLKFAPLLNIENEKISMLGKNGVILYINGKKSNIPSNQILAYLKSLPAEKIQNIELITDPGIIVRNDDNKGIINLNLKKNEMNGLKGTISLDDNQKHYNSQSVGMYLDYQKDKLNVTTNIYAGNNKSYNKSKSDFHYINSAKHQTVYDIENENYRNLGATLRVDYNLSDNQIIGMTINGSYNKNSNNRFSNTSFRQFNANTIDSIITSSDTINNSIRNLSANLSYRIKTDDRGSFFFADIDFLANRRENLMHNDFARVQDHLEESTHDRFEQKMLEDLDNYSGKAEYKAVLDDKNSLIIGAEIYSSCSNANFYFGDWSNNEYVNDIQKTNFFEYQEFFVSSYLSYNRKWSSKFNTRIEARIEYVDSKGLQRITSDEIKRTYFDIIPGISLFYQINPDNRVSYNFTKIAARPGYYSLNPFRFFLTPTTYKEFNPNLEPAKLYINNFSYVLKNHYILGLNYNYISNCTNNFLIPVDNQYTKYINANYGKNQSTTLYFSWNNSFWDNTMQLNSNISGQYMRNKGQVESIIVDVSDFSYQFFFSTGVALSKKYNWNLTTNFTYRSKSRQAYEDINDFYMLNVGIRKTFKNNVSINMGVNNLLYNDPSKKKINDNYMYAINEILDFRSIYVSISIPFGNTKTKGAQNRNTSSSETIRRLKE